MFKNIDEIKSHVDNGLKVYYKNIHRIVRKTVGEYVIYNDLSHISIPLEHNSKLYGEIEDYKNYNDADKFDE